MPCALIKGYILDYLAIAANQTMRRNAQMSNPGEVRMRVGIQCTGK
ncbi:hypothetical protein P848_00270 [Klebsiella aerogenes UCI 45]|nr:hypothetical protein P848_00270 [Klebsiella aerogenes UCI 45]